MLTYCFISNIVKIKNNFNMTVNIFEKHIVCVKVLYISGWVCELRKNDAHVTHILIAYFNLRTWTNNRICLIRIAYRFLLAPEQEMTRRAWQEMPDITLITQILDKSWIGARIDFVIRTYLLALSGYCRNFYCITLLIY